MVVQDQLVVQDQIVVMVEVGTNIFHRLREQF